GVIEMLMGIQDLRDAVALLLRALEALARIQRIYHQRLAALRAGDQVVEISQVVRGPDSFDEHRAHGLRVSGSEGLIEQSMLRCARHAVAPRGAFSDHRVDVDVPPHALGPFADVEQAEAAVTGWQAIDAVHLEADTGIDDVEHELLAVHRQPYRGALGT